MLKNGTTSQIEACCADLVSLTRAEMATMTAIEIRASKGDQIRKSTNHPGLIMVANTCGLAERNARLKINKIPLSQVIPTPGTRAARLFPTNNSQVRMGVASNGSNVRLVFSPMILYE